MSPSTTLRTFRPSRGRTGDAVFLDTNVWIDYLKGVDPVVCARIQRSPTEAIVVCSVVLAELLHGAKKYGAADRREALVLKTLGFYDSHSFDDDAAAIYGRLRHTTESGGKRIGSNDLMIAAIALQYGLTLVTNDQAFSRIEGLSIEDWRAG